MSRSRATKKQLVYKFKLREDDQLMKKKRNEHNEKEREAETRGKKRVIQVTTQRGVTGSRLMGELREQKGIVPLKDMSLDSTFNNSKI